MSLAIADYGSLQAPLLTEFKGIPFLGASPFIKKDPLNFLSALVNRSDKVLKMQHVGQTVFLVNSPIGIEYVLEKANKKFRKGNFYNKVKPVFGKGLPVLEKEDWKRHRQLMQPSFRKQELERIAYLSVELANDLIAKWTSSSNKTVNVDADMAKLTLDVVAFALFGADIRKYADKVVQAIDDVLSIAELRIWAAPDLYWNWLSPYYWRFKSARKTLDSVIYEFVERRKNGETFGSDLLGTLIMAMEIHGEKKITDIELRDEITTLLVTGHESTANTLTWMFYELAQHPDIQEKVINELFENLGNRNPLPEDFDNLPFTKAVIQEVLRLYPAAWSLARANLEDVEIEGVFIPAGSNVMISPYLMQRHRQFYKNPEAFRPERFLNGEMDSVPKYAYFPFAGGPRGCIGEGFAWQEIFSVASVICRKVRFELAPGQKVTPIARVAIKPEHGMRMVITEHHRSN